MLGALTSDRGVTLAEVTVVLLAVSILAGAAAPSARRALDRAKLARAVSDETAIKTAISNWIADMTGYFGFTIDGATGAVNSANTTQTLVSDGDMPRDCVATSGCGGGAISWNAPVDNVGGLTDFLERHLVTNTPRGSAANDYPVGAGAWRGAYVSGPIDPDPWGNRYAVNVKWLKDDSNCGSRSNDTLVLSAGPDEIINTNYRFDVFPACGPNTAGTGGAIPANDDIIVVVRRDVGGLVP
jgi:prepilin-type N-terminal cleavage/methylation domain-containing protein